MRCVRSRGVYIGLLCASAIVLAGWAWSGSQRDTEPVNPEPILIEPVVAPCAPDSSAHALANLRPGMSRTTVESLFGPPTHVNPVTARGDAVTYSATFEINFSCPTGSPPSRTVMTAEFDASKPGHPLLTFQIVLPAS